MELNSMQIEMCAEWCRSHYWQIQEKRSWRYRFHESVMVRYYEEANLDPSLLEPLIEFLKNGSWQSCCQVHNKPFDATGWVTRDAWYQTGDGDNKDATKIKVTRIYHAMTKAESDGQGDGPYVIENGCAYKVSFEFFWKQTNLPVVPASTSGVSYRLTGVNRDDDTGLFSCVLEKRERVQQDIPEYVSEMTAFKTTSREEHKGVAGGVDSGGKAASVTLGKVVSRRVQKNEDCTHDVDNVTEESVEMSGSVTETTVGVNGAVTTTVNRNMRSPASDSNLEVGDSVRNELQDDLTWTQTIRTRARNFLQWVRGVCRKTIFRHTHSVTTATSTDPGFSHVSVPTSDPGKVHELDVQRTEVGWSVTETENEDFPVTAAVQETRVYLDGVVTTTVNRNQAAGATTSGIGIGGSVRNEKTESGLVDQTIVSSAAEDVGKTGEHCEQSHLVHTHGETDVLGSDNAPQTIEVTAGAGQTVSKRMERTDRGGYRVVTETRTSKTGEAESTGGTSSRTVVTKTVRNATSVPTESVSQNVEVDISAQSNEFGRNDCTVRKTTYSPETTTATGGTQLYTEVTTTTTNDTNVNPSQDSSQGVVVMTSASPTGRGSANVTKTTRTAHSLSMPDDFDIIEWQDVNLSASRKTVYNNKIVVFRNVANAPSVDPGSVGSCSVSISINEFGLLDGVYHYRSIVSDEPRENNRSDVSMEYTADMSAYDRNGALWQGKVTVYTNMAGALKTGFMNGARNYEQLGLRSTDNGRHGVKYHDWAKVV